MNDFFQQVVQNYSKKLKFISAKPIFGGCINNAYKLETNNESLFLKWNLESSSNMFECEKNGLEILKQHSPILSPGVLSSGIENDKSYLLLEWIETGHQTPDFWQSFASNLAVQHRVSNPYFGLDHDNYMGSLEQFNKQHDSWYDFFINERLIPQLKLAEAKNLISSNHLTKFEALFTKLEELIPTEPPALLHGDLWSGNFMCSNSGEAVIFDPAVHFGHRETELAFTHLFGGFSPKFYDYYNDEFPLESGFDSRIELHNLYPLLVHLILFGSSYLSGIDRTLKRFI